MSQLDVGLYLVTISAPGHKTFSAGDVKIDIGQEYSLNATLEVGQVSENVTVVAGADVVNSTNAELSSTISPRQVLELPLNGRNPLALLNTVAGQRDQRFDQWREVINHELHAGWHQCAG